MQLRYTHYSSVQVIRKLEFMIISFIYFGLFTTIEMFEHLLGELQVSTSIKSLMENGISAMPSDVLQFKQRRREIQLALSLAKRLDDVETSEDLEVFQEKARKEAIELSETPLGGALLGLIGNNFC